MQGNSQRLALGARRVIAKSLRRRQKPSRLHALLGGHVAMFMPRNLKQFFGMAVIVNNERLPRINQIHKRHGGNGIFTPKTRHDYLLSVRRPPNGLVYLLVGGLR
jgi:hypothetical protein